MTPSERESTAEGRHPLVDYLRGLKSGTYIDNRGRYVVSVDGHGQLMDCTKHTDPHRFKQIQLYRERRGNSGKGKPIPLPFENLYVSSETGEMRIALYGTIESAVHPGMRFAGVVTESFGPSDRHKKLNDYADRVLMILKRAKPL